jgi:hypothetical protein
MIHVPAPLHLLIVCVCGVCCHRRHRQIHSDVSRCSDQSKKLNVERTCSSHHRYGKALKDENDFFWFILSADERRPFKGHEGGVITVAVFPDK